MKTSKGAIVLCHRLLMAPSTEAKKQLILPLGDSITQGVTGNDSPNKSAPGGYRHYLKELLDQKETSFTFIGNRNANPSLSLIKSGQESHQGHPGAVIEQLAFHLENYLHAENKSPDIILLMAGTNNLGLGEQTPEEAGKYMDALLNKISLLMPNTITIVSTLIPYDGDTAPEREAKQVIYNTKILPKLVTRHQERKHKVVLFDMRVYFDLANSATHLSGDKVHPSQLGYQAIANGWFQALKELGLINTNPHKEVASQRDLW